MPRLSDHPPRLTVAALAAALVAALLVLLPGTAAQAAPVLLSQGRPATASSQENGATPASAAVDGDNATRWSSQFADPQWIQVDLGTPARVSQVVLRWETAYATAYRIELSDDGTHWSTAYSTTAATGGVRTHDITGTARHVRVYGTQRATQWGYSLYEFQVFGTTDTGPTLPGGGDLGPNVIVFDPSTPNIQARLDEVFRQQESAQF
ncbi:coagulation factor 5/8 type domain-containing protein, partial [Streptomyces sp. NRRL S-444]